MFGVGCGVMLFVYGMSEGSYLYMESEGQDEGLQEGCEVHCGRWGRGMRVSR